MTSVRIYAKIDLDDVLDELSDEQLREAMERRCIDTARNVEQAKEDSLRPMLEEALDLLRSGRAEDAALCLERALFPKWKTPEDSFKQLRAGAA